MVASTSIDANADESDFEGADFEKEDSEEKVEESGRVNEVYFPADLVLDEYKSQDRRAMKIPMEEYPTQKKMSSLFMDNLKVQKMQFVSLHLDLKTMMDDIDTAKN